MHTPKVPKLFPPSLWEERAGAVVGVLEAPAPCGAEGAWIVGVVGAGVVMAG